MSPNGMELDHGTRGSKWLDMFAIRVRYLVILIFVSIFISEMGVAVLYNTDFGYLDVKIVSIPNEGGQISGLLYRPIDATAENPLPAVILVHGISGSKQMLSGIALELARQGFITLAIDLVGHGNSEGVFGGGNVDLTLGTMAAVRYLESQSFVKSSLIGLVGHSLGAGAIRAAAVAHGNITASVYIGGGFGGMVTDSAYGILNSTFPKNLLIAVGKQDVLFNLDQFKKELLPVFGNPQEIIDNRLYGNFSTQTARKLITPVTTHLFEPIDPSITLETILWMDNTLKSGNSDQKLVSEKNFIFLYREVAIFFSLAAFVSLIFSISSIILDICDPLVQKKKLKTKYGVLEDWKTMVMWGIFGLVLFPPMFFVGTLIPIPPLIFGSSFAWWLFTVGILGLLLILFLLPKFSTVKLNLRLAISESFNFSYAMIAVGIFILSYLIAYITETFFITDLRIFVIPVFNDLKPINRIPMFLLLLPFLIVYFFVEGLYFHEFHDWSIQKSGLISEALAMGKVVAIKICPYVVLFCIHYAPMFWLNVRLLPTFIGFLLEFFWGVPPLFIISTACSWWFYRKTSTIGIGAILNSLLFAWSAAATFPLGTFKF